MSDSQGETNAVRPGIDRREFIAAAGAAAAVAALPLAAAARAADLPDTASVEGAPSAAPLAHWTIDDMWGVNPRYADPIGYGRPDTARDLQALADPADLPFLA